MDNYQKLRAKSALNAIRESLISPRRAASNYGVTVPDIHEYAGCREGANCTGPGCRI